MTTNITNAGRTLTKNAKSLAGAVNVNLTELAGLSGLSKSTLYRIETARKFRRTYHPMMSTVIKLADVAGVTVDDFIKSRLSFQ